MEKCKYLSNLNDYGCVCLYYFLPRNSDAVGQVEGLDINNFKPSFRFIDQSCELPGLFITKQGFYCC